MSDFKQQTLDLFIQKYETFSQGKYIDPITLKKLMMQPIAKKVAKPTPSPEKISPIMVDITPQSKFIYNDKIDYCALRIRMNKAKITLPFLPQYINYTGCQNILFNGSLFTPCGKKTNNIFCNKCNEVKYGTLHDRLNGSFRHHSISYNKFISKKKISLDKISNFLETNQISFIPLPNMRVRTPSTDSENLSDIESDSEPCVPILLHNKKIFRQSNHIYDEDGIIIGNIDNHFIYDNDGVILGKIDDDGDIINIES